MFDLIRDGVVEVVGEVRARLVGGGVGGRALPVGDVDGIKVFGDHGDLDRVMRAKCAPRHAIGLVSLLCAKAS